MPFLSAACFVIACRAADECLDFRWFRTSRHARADIGRWRNRCDSERPHSAFEYLSPAGRRMKTIASAPSALAVASRPSGTRPRPEDSGRARTRSRT
ncbi:MAG: integrase core domain-containing protein [Shimia sp.]